MQQLSKVVRRIVEEYKPERIILFGSYAWGKPTRDSDFDLLIIKRGKKDFLVEQQKVRRIINGEVAADILIHTPKEVNQRVRWGDFFFQDIIQKGRYLYEKANSKPAS